ncbi:MAG: PAS domain S-box protein [Candidatus Latescibacteria bacterium]|nr:PAS domain S-box protein [Candidatus Latescibacterota bacterium]
MSPLTQLGFICLGLSCLASLSPAVGRPWRGRAAYALAALVFLAGLTLLLCYLFGKPLLYEGQFIPPALPTSLAFASLGLGLMALAERHGESSYRPTPNPAVAPPARTPMVIGGLLVMAATATAIFVSVQAEEESTLDQAGKELLSIATQKAQELAAFQQERWDDGLFYFHNRPFASVVQRAFAQPHEALVQQELEAWLNQRTKHARFDRIVLLDTTGALRLSVPSAAAPIGARVVQGAAALQRSGEMGIEDFYRDEYDQQVRLAVLVPIFAPDDSRRALGTLVLRIDPHADLYPLLQRWPGTAHSEEALLVRREGDRVLFLNDLRFQDHTALSLSVPMDHTERPSVRAALGEEGVVQGRDYRGPMVAGIRKVPNSPWYLVARMDLDEALAPVQAVLPLWIALLASLLASLGIGVVLFERHRTLGFYREQARVARELRESEELFRSLFEDHSAVKLIIEVSTGQIRDANSAAAQYYGWSREELRQLRIQDINILPPEEVQQRMAEAEAAKRSYFEFRHRRADGSVRDVEVFSSRLHRKGSVLLHSIVHDVTERTRLEQELIRTHRLRAAGELSVGVSHNLNNLLTVVLGPAEMLQRRLLDPKSLQLVEMVIEAATRAADLVHRLHLSVRDPESQTCEPVALNQTIEGVLAMTRPRWKDESKTQGRAIEVYTDLGLVPPIKGITSELHGMLVNLLLNAVEAMPQGGRITIRTLSEGDQVRLDFSDTGVGMDEQTRLRVFEPFFTTKMDVGSGLGLSTLYNSVTHWGGTVAVASTPGQGTTFTLHLPAWPRTPGVAPEPARTLAT